MSIFRKLANRIDPPSPPQPIPGVERIARPTPPTHTSVGLSTDQRLARLEGEVAFLARTVWRTHYQNLTAAECEQLDAIMARR